MPLSDARPPLIHHRLKETVKDSINEQPMRVLAMLDFVLERVSNGHLELVRRLTRALEKGASAWRVVVADDGRGFALQRRVSDEVQEQYDRTASAEDQATDHLRAAWRGIYGMPPDAKGAYEQAVLAVEAASHPVLGPDDGNYTLTKGLATLRGTVVGKPSGEGKFGIDLGVGTGREDDWPDSGIHAVLRMMQALAHGQPRHAGQHREIGIPEAEAALHMALTLVHLFRNGLVYQRS